MQVTPKKKDTLSINFTCKVNSKTHLDIFWNYLRNFFHKVTDLFFWVSCDSFFFFSFASAMVSPRWDSANLDLTFSSVSELNMARVFSYDTLPVSWICSLKIFQINIDVRQLHKFLPDEAVIFCHHMENISCKLAYCLFHSVSASHCEKYIWNNYIAKRNNMTFTDGAWHGRQEIISF